MNDIKKSCVVVKVHTPKNIQFLSVGEIVLEFGKKTNHNY